MRTLLHNSQAERIEVLDNRYYTNDMENFYPGSTTILDSFPKGVWYAKWLKENGDNADKIRDDAAEIGSIVHQATESIDNGKQLFWSDDNGKPSSH